MNKINDNDNDSDNDNDNDNDNISLDSANVLQTELMVFTQFCIIFTIIKHYFFLNIPL